MDSESAHLLQSKAAMCILFGTQTVACLKLGVETADNIFQNVFYVWILYLAASSIESIPGWERSAFDRMTGHTPTSFLCLQVYCLRTALHAPFVALYRTNRIPNLFHHAFTWAVFAYACETGRIHFYLCAMLATELSNLPLCGLLLAKERGRKPLEVVFGCLFFLSYLLTRVLFYPLVLYVYWRDTRLHANGWIEGTLIPVFALLLYGLYLHWFAKVARGAKRLLAGKKA